VRTPCLGSLVLTLTLSLPPLAFALVLALALTLTLGLRSLLLKAQRIVFVSFIAVPS